MNRKTDNIWTRRRFLRGAGGLTIALPFLDAFTRHRSAHAQAKPYIPFVMIVNSCGVVQDGGDMFWPSKLGPLTKASLMADSGRATSELAEYADRLLMVKGINLGFQGVAQCGHADGACQVTTAAGIKGTRNNARATGESIDHRIAREMNPGGKEGILLYAGKKGTYNDDFISYSGPGQLREGENNPANAYRQLIGLGTTTAPTTPTSNAVADALKTRRTTAMDLVREELQEFMTRTDLSMEDRQRLQLHFKNVEELGNDLNPMMTSSGGAPAKAPYDAIATSFAAENNVTVAARLHIDLAVYAISTGMNRVAAIQVGAGADRTRRVIDGKLVEYSYHRISHRVNSDGASGSSIPDARILHHKIDRIHAQDFRRLLEKMDSYKTPQGSLLDIGIAMWTNELATGPSHSRNGIPYVIGGKARGALKTGQVYDAKGTLNNKLLSTLITAAGVRQAGGGIVDNFGHANHPKGVLSDLLMV